MIAGTMALKPSVRQSMLSLKFRMPRTQYTARVMTRAMKEPRTRPTEASESAKELTKPLPSKKPPV